MTYYADSRTKPPLDESFYGLSDEESAFLKETTGIRDDDMLKRHIIAVQKKAYELYGYPCIRFFAFTKLRISRLPSYLAARRLLLDRPDAILLDMGCCFGSDIRKAVADGWPAQNVIGLDLLKGFWDSGHELFNSTPETFPAAFVAGDVFDSNIISPHAPFVEEPNTPRSDLASLDSLTPLLGHVSVIYASSFFHLFSEARQTDLARRIASLLSPRAGSIIFGSHIGKLEKGLFHEGSKDEPTLFCHSIESWCDLWDGEVFEKGTVKVAAQIKRVEKPGLSTSDEPFYFLFWSITRQ